ncbi:hypothetical protein M405DRAFT_496499 [Rhizopogon salebrosus TDB-379]|nr:hypothetical protein M405DRAFT_496499 [Rhizopogon salebrosus TDB-379]
MVNRGQETRRGRRPEPLHWAPGVFHYHLSSAAFGSLVYTLMVIRRSLTALNEPQDGWPPSRGVENKPPPSFATEDIDIFREGDFGSLLTPVVHIVTLYPTGLSRPTKHIPVRVSTVPRHPRQVFSAQCSLY